VRESLGIRALPVEGAEEESRPAKLKVVKE
jgi:hypothetical protein